MKKIATTVIGAIAIAGSGLTGVASAAAAAPITAFSSASVITASPTRVIHCPVGSYAIVVRPGPVWGCTKSVFDQGHHRRHHHP